MQEQGQIMDNNSYNIIMALASNLEAYEAYRKYSKDGNAELWQKLSKNAEEAVQLLHKELAKVSTSSK